MRRTHHSIDLIVFFSGCKDVKCQVRNHRRPTLGYAHPPTLVLMVFISLHHEDGKRGCVFEDWLAVMQTSGRPGRTTERTTPEDGATRAKSSGPGVDKTPFGQCDDTYMRDSSGGYLSWVYLPTG